MRAKRGFTLVELLVVIGIIALLMAMLLPMLNKAREASKQTVCASNLQQIGRAVRMYADQYDQMIPPAPNLGLWEMKGTDGIIRMLNPASSAAYWGVQYLCMVTTLDPDPAKDLEAQTKGARSLWRCPSSLRVDTDIGSNGFYYYDPDQPANIGVNMFATGVKLTKWRHPSDVIFAHDAAEHRMEGNGDSLSTWDVPVNANSINLTQWRVGGSSYFPDAIWEFYRHNKYCNVLWMDGHVSALGYSTGKDVPRRWYMGEDASK